MSNSTSLATWEVTEQAGEGTGLTADMLREFGAKAAWGKLSEEAALPALVARLVWSTFSKEALPDTLTDGTGDQEGAVDNSSSKDGETRDHSVAFSVTGTNWDAVLDTAGLPAHAGDGLPPLDPTLLQQPGQPSPIDQPGQQGPPPQQPGQMAACGKFLTSACPGGGVAQADCPCSANASLAECGVLPSTACPVDGSVCESGATTATCTRAMAACGAVSASMCPTDGSACANELALSSCPDHRGQAAAEDSDNEPGLDPMSQISKYDWDAKAFPA